MSDGGFPLNNIHNPNPDQMRQRLLREDDIGFNKATGRRNLQPVDTDLGLAGKAAQRTLEETVHFEPLSRRPNGAANIREYHILNGFTLGSSAWWAEIKGADKQVMGSQKRTGDQILAKTHLNVTVAQEQGKPLTNTQQSLRIASKVWKWGWTIANPVNWVLAPIALYKRHNLNKEIHDTLKSNFEAAYNRPPTANVLKNMSVDRLMEIAEGKNDAQVKAATKDAYAIRANRSNPAERHGSKLTAEEFMRGGDDLKALFAVAIFKAQSPEVYHGLDWSMEMTRGIPGAPEDPNPLRDPNSTYELNMHQLVQGYSTLIEKNAPVELNIPDHEKRKWKKAVEEDLQAFRDDWNATVDALDNSKNALQWLKQKKPDIPDYEERVAGLEQNIRELRDKLEDMKTWTADADVSRKFGVLLHQVFIENKLLAEPQTTALSEQLSTAHDRGLPKEAFDRRALADQPYGSEKVLAHIKKQYGEKTAMVVKTKFLEGLFFKWKNPVSIDTMDKIERFLQTDEKAQAALADKNEPFEPLVQAAETIRANRPGPRRFETTLSPEEMLDAPAGLRNRFLEEARAQNAPQAVDYMLWARDTTRGIDNALLQPVALRDDNSTYELNCAQLLDGYHRLVQDANPANGPMIGGNAPINIFGPERQQWDKAVQTHLGDFSRDYTEVQNRIAQTRAAIDQAQKNGGDTAQLRQTLNELNTRLQDLQTRKLPPDASRVFGKLIQEAYNSQRKFAQQPARALSHELLAPGDEFQGLDDDEGIQMRKRMARQPNGTALVHAKIAQVHGQDRADALFQKHAADATFHPARVVFNQALDPDDLARIEKELATLNP